MTRRTSGLPIVRRAARIAISVCALCALVVPAWTHGDLDERLRVLDAEIAAQPHDAGLRLRRAILRLEHDDAAGALEDLELALRLDPTAVEAQYRRGGALVALDRHAEAVAAFDAYLAAVEGDSAARLARARCLRRLGRHREALADFAVGVDRAFAPDPQDVLDWADAAAEVDGHEAALRVLTEATSRFGQCSAFEDGMLRRELALGRHEAALARLDRRMAGSARKEPWLARRGDVLAEMGDAPGARRAWRDALAALERVPVERRGTAASAALAAGLRERLARADAAPSAPRGP